MFEALIEMRKNDLNAHRGRFSGTGPLRNEGHVRACVFVKSLTANARWAGVLAVEY